MKKQIMFRRLLTMCLAGALAFAAVSCSDDNDEKIIDKDKEITNVITLENESIEIKNSLNQVDKTGYPDADGNFFYPHVLMLFGDGFNVTAEGAEGEGDILTLYLGSSGEEIEEGIYTLSGFADTYSVDGAFQIASAYHDKLTPQQICGLTSQSEWTGVLLSTLFRETGLQAGSKWFLAEGGDACRMTRSIPLDRALKEGMLVYAQNGEALRPQHGYPLRLLLPGWEGNMSVKWLRRIEVSDQPWMTREETSKYTESVHDKIRQFSFDMDARSIITYPAYPHHVERGWIEIRGIAWSGRGKITRVEVSTDGGKTWQNANLQGPVLDKAHTRFAHIWRWDGSTTEIQSRATDETGYVQPTLKLLREARGARSGYHFNPIMGWILNQDGSVLLNPDA